MSKNSIIKWCKCHTFKWLVLKCVFRGRTNAHWTVQLYTNGNEYRIYNAIPPEMCWMKGSYCMYLVEKTNIEHSENAIYSCWLALFPFHTLTHAFPFSMRKKIVGESKMSWSFSVFISPPPPFRLFKRSTPTHSIWCVFFCFSIRHA